MQVKNKVIENAKIKFVQNILQMTNKNKQFKRST